MFLWRDERRQGRDDLWGDVEAHDDQNLRNDRCTLLVLQGFYLCSTLYQIFLVRIRRVCSMRSVACDDLSVVLDGGELGVFDCP